jgi:hypothetical protein
VRRDRREETEGRRQEKETGETRQKGKDREEETEGKRKRGREREREETYKGQRKTEGKREREERETRLTMTEEGNSTGKETEWKRPERIERTPKIKWRQRKDQNREKEGGGEREEGKKDINRKKQGLKT